MHWESLAARCSCSIQNADDSSYRSDEQIADMDGRRERRKLLQGLVDRSLVVQLHMPSCRYLFKPSEGSSMRNNIKRTIANLAETFGQDVIEFPLVTVLIALGCATAMTSLDTKIITAFAAVGTRLTASV
jgi:Flp pilus assembly pilin Flp